MQNERSEECKVETYHRIQNAVLHGELLTSDGIRIICGACNGDARAIGEHILNLLPKLRAHIDEENLSPAKTTRLTTKQTVELQRYLREIEAERILLPEKVLEICKRCDYDAEQIGMYMKRLVMTEHNAVIKISEATWRRALKLLSHPLSKLLDTQLGANPFNNIGLGNCGFENGAILALWLSSDNIRYSLVIELLAADGSTIEKTTQIGLDEVLVLYVDGGRTRYKVEFDVV